MNLVKYQCYARCPEVCLQSGPLLVVFHLWSGIEGPHHPPQTAKYAITAVIGHRLLVRARYMSTLFLKGFILEDLIQTYMMVGFVWLSTAMSEKTQVCPWAVTQSSCWEAIIDCDFLHHDFLCETTLLPFRVPAFWLSQLPQIRRMWQQTLS